MKHDYFISCFLLLLFCVNPLSAQRHFVNIGYPFFPSVNQNSGLVGYPEKQLGLSLGFTKKLKNKWYYKASVDYAKVKNTMNQGFQLTTFTSQAKTY